MDLIFVNVVLFEYCVKLNDCKLCFFILSRFEIFFFCFECLNN